MIRWLLIGGQAVNFWAEQYLAVCPELQQSAPFTSKDVDFQGPEESAVRLARCLGAMFEKATKARSENFIGVVRLAATDVDFLTQPYAVGKELAPEVVLQDSIRTKVGPGGAFELRVMHPVHCLKSRTFNVVGHPESYANDRGLRQLQASILCAREFVNRVAAQNTRQALRHIETIFRFCLTPEACSVYRDHQIDVFEAVSATAELPAEYHTKRYPQMRQQLARRRRQNPSLPPELRR